MSVAVLTRNTARFVVLLLCILVSPAYAAGDNYTLEDLQALDKEGQYDQVLQHMNDIRPSQRDDDWKRIVHRAVLPTLQKQVSDGDTTAALALTEKMLDLDPAWKESGKFMELRGQAVIEEAGMCYRNSYYSAECTEKLTALVKKTPGDRELAFKAGKLARLRANAAAAVPLFSLALKDGDTIGGCSDEDVLLAVESGMGLPPKSAEQARELGFSICFDELQPHLLEDFFTSDGYAVANYCNAFSAKNVLTDFQRAYCLDQQ